MVRGATNLRRGVLIPSIAAAMAFAVLLSLGLWQLDRKAWKEGLIATLEQRLSAPPVVFPAPATWSWLRGGVLVMVNRGFVPNGKQDTATRSDGEVAGPINMVGVLRWPEPPGVFTPAGDPTRNIWFSRDSSAIAAAKGVNVAPFYLELESPDPPGGLPRVGRLHPTLPNNHFGYALTWLGLACVLVGVYGTWLFGSWRKRHGTVEYGA